MPAKCIGYDLEKPPGLRNVGGGIGTKYARVEEASEWHECRNIATIKEIEADDIVFADWLWFVGDQEANRVDKIKEFIELPNIKGVYGSELSVLTWPSKEREQLVASVDFITHNTEYQRQLYQAVDIYNSCFLCDPIPEDVFVPTRNTQKRRLVCMGQISLAKRSDAVVEIFKHLKDSGVERCYIGGKQLWGDYKTGRIESDLHDEIKAASDLFIENAKQAELAENINNSAFYGHVSHHDVASSGCQENMLGGSVVFGLGHPMLKERTPYRFDNPKELADAIKSYKIGSEQHIADVKRMIKTAEQWSYAAWNKQIETVLRVAR